MKIAISGFTKVLLIVTGSLITVVVAILLLISPIAKHLIEKYGAQYTGRQITLDWIYLNPFTGYVHISNLQIYDSKVMPPLPAAESVFFSAKGLSANFAILKLFSKTIEISEVSLDSPKGIIIQTNRDFNFNDLIKLFTPVHRSKTPSAVHFSILATKIINGEFHYRENLIPINYYIKNVNIESTGKRWNSDTIAAKFSFRPGIGPGEVKGDFTINFKSLDYRYRVVIHKFDLDIIAQYLRQLTNDGHFTANLDADMKAKGNFKDEENLTASGLVAVNDFHFGKSLQDDFVSFERLVLTMIDFSPNNHKYFFDSVSLIHPYFKYERYDKLDNLQTMFGINGSNITAAKEDPARFNLVIEIARYIKVIARNFFRSDYKLNRLAIYNADVKFNDFAVSEKFTAELNPLFVLADSIDKSHQWADVSIKSGICPYGSINISLSISPKDSTDFNLQYNLSRLPASAFNPYLITYTSFPVDRGTIELNGTWKVRHGIIQSVNHIVIIDPRVTWRRKNKGTAWIPMKLIMSLIRERGNVIDYEIPITGNLKDPKFHLHDVIVDLLENIFVKPATSAYRMQVKNVETEIEKTLTVKWQMRQNSLRPEQVRFIKRMADYLLKNPEAKISVHPQEYELKEKEYILFFEARKKYFMAVNHINSRSFNEDDSEKVDRMSVSDSLFVRYVNKQVNDTLLFTRQEKCTRFVGTAMVEAKFQLLARQRKEAFMEHFLKIGGKGRINVSPGVNIIPYNGFSFYSIDYNGELPKKLLSAYRQMNELNKESPRKKFRKERRQNRSVIDK